MGFSNESHGGNGKYANFKEGQIVTYLDGKKQSFTTLTGKIVDIDIQDAVYQGKEYRKVVLYIQHEDGITMLGFPLASGYGWSFFQLCTNINEKKECSISGGTEDFDGKKWGKMFIKQDNVYIKQALKKGTPAHDKIPPVKEIKNGKGKVTGKDYSDRDDFMEKVITAFFKKVQKAYPNAVDPEMKKAYAAAAKADAVTEAIDDMPF